MFCRRRRHLTCRPRRLRAPPARRQALRKTRDDLLRCVRGAESGDAAGRASACVAELTAARQPFNEALLGGGSWRVVYTEGAFLWQLYTSPGKLMIGSKNAASQTLDPRTRSVLNFGEVAGSRVFVTAEGVYEPQASRYFEGFVQFSRRLQAFASARWSYCSACPPQDASSSTPKAIDVRIDGGALHLFGTRVPLPIRGRGSFEVAYLDDTLRIFRSPNGSVSVQVREDMLVGQ